MVFEVAAEWITGVGNGFRSIYILSISRHAVVVPSVPSFMEAGAFGCCIWMKMVLQGILLYRSTSLLVVLFAIPCCGIRSFPLSISTRRKK